MKLLNQGHPGDQDQNLKPGSSSVIHLCSLMPPWLWGYPGLYWVLVLFTFRPEGTAILALDFMILLCHWVAHLCPPPIAALPMRCRCLSASSTTLCQDRGHALFICVPMVLMTAPSHRRWGICEPGTCAVPGPPSIFSHASLSEKLFLFLLLLGLLVSHCEASFAPALTHTVELQTVVAALWIAVDHQKHGLYFPECYYLIN